jgi:hypothetical protein
VREHRDAGDGLHFIEVLDAGDEKAGAAHFGGAADGLLDCIQPGDSSDFDRPPAPRQFDAPDDRAADHSHDHREPQVIGVKPLASCDGWIPREGGGRLATIGRNRNHGEEVRLAAATFVDRGRDAPGVVGRLVGNEGRANGCENTVTFAGSFDCVIRDSLVPGVGLIVGREGKPDVDLRAVVPGMIGGSDVAGRMRHISGE